MQRQRMPAGHHVERFEPRTAVHHVVLWMDFEPQALSNGLDRLGKVFGLEAKARAHGSMHGRSPSSATRGQRLGTGRAGDHAPVLVSEPWPLGVTMAVQVPAGTFFHALAW